MKDFVFDKNHVVITVGAQVKWHDPAINEYDPEDRAYARNRVFTVSEIRNEENVLIDEIDENGAIVTEAEVLPDELEIIDGFVDDEFYLRDDELFGDDYYEEPEYDCRCYDGYAICRCKEDDVKLLPNEKLKLIIMTYTKRDRVLKDSDLCDEILDYRGLYDLYAEDICFSDIAIYEGKCHTLSQFKRNHRALYKKIIEKGQL